MSFYKEVPGRQTTLESTLKFDTEPKAGSTNPVTSDGVKSAIDGAVGDAAAALQEQIDDIAEKAGSGYIPKGEATVATLNALSGQENGELYTMTDAGTLTEGSLAVVAGDTVAWDATNEVWYKAMDYAPRQYGTNEVHNLPTAITAFRTGDVIAVDGPSGTAKISKDDLLRVTAENAVNSGVVVSTKKYNQQIGRALLGKNYDFVNGKCYTYDGVGLTETESTNWSYVVVEESEFLRVNLVASASDFITPAPPVVLLDGPDPSTANVVDVVYGDEEVPGYIQLARLNGTINVGGRCKYVLLQVNVYADYGSQMYWQTSTDDVMSFAAPKYNLVKKYATSENAVLKEYLLQVISGTLSATYNVNWNYYIFPAEDAVHVKAFGSDDSGIYPPVVFLSKPVVKQENYISCLWSDSGEYTFDDDITVPAGCKFIAINCAKTQLSNGLGVTYKKTTWKDCIVVDSCGGGDYLTLSEAISSCAGGETIFVRPGIYEGPIRLINIPDVKIIGEDKDTCIIESNDGYYTNPPVEIMSGVLENLTIRAKYVNGVSQEIDASTPGAYAVHIDNFGTNDKLPIGRSLIIRNCVLHSDFFPALGCGAFPNWTLRLEDCEFINSQVSGRGAYSTGADETLGALYIHDSNTVDIGRAKIIIKNCVVKNENFKNAMCMYDRSYVDGRGNDFLFVGNVLVGDEGQDNNIWWRSAANFLGDFTNSNASYGNSNSDINN